MKNIFGKNAAQAVYYHLEKRHLLKLEDIIEKPHTFSEAIKEMFGETGAEVIEALLVKDLCTKFRVEGQRKEAKSKHLPNLDISKMPPSFFYELPKGYAVGLTSSFISSVLSAVSSALATSSSLAPRSIVILSFVGSM